MTNDESTEPDLYRRTAIKLRVLAAQFDHPDVKAELVDIAARFEKLAEYVATRHPIAMSSAEPGAPPRSD